MVRFRIVDLGKDYPGKIDNFADARNSFMEKLPDGEYILFVDSDEEPTQMLLNHIRRLAYNGIPYYRVRRINLYNGRYREGLNPEFQPRLVSNKVRWVGRMHETVTPSRPYGRIDYPMIHDGTGGTMPRNIGRWRWHFISLALDSKLFAFYVSFKKVLLILWEEWDIPPTSSQQERTMAKETA